jgi:hypothetical protein
MFTRVDQKQAGAAALGILVPTGTPTLVIVRPRALSWDLIPARWDGDGQHPPQFCAFSRDEAATVARRLVKSLEAALERGVNPLETFGDAGGASCGIWLRTDEFVWIVCRRVQGQAYQPMIWASMAEAASEAEKITPFVWPAAEARQQYYFNTQNFG